MSDESDSEMDQGDQTEMITQEDEAKIEKKIRKTYRKIRQEMIGIH